MSTIREDLEAAADGVDVITTDPVESTPEPVVEAVETQPEATETERVDRARDESGKFTKKTEKSAAAKGTEANGAAKPTSAAGASADGVVAVPGETSPAAATPSAEPAKPESTAFKPPQSWTPAEREALLKAPPEVQKAVERREREIQSGLQESAPARKFNQELMEAARPYEAHLQATGVSIPAAIQQYGQMHQAAHRGTAQQLGSVISALAGVRQDPERMAQAYAHAIRELPEEVFQRLNQHLNQPGQAAQHQPVDIDAAVDRVFQAKLQAAQQMKARQEESSFAEKHEFYADIKPMVDALMQSTGVGRQEAYDMALPVHPKTAEVMKQRKAAAAATATSASTQRAKVAASSIKSSPSSQVNGSDPKSIRDYLEAAANRR